MVKRRGSYDDFANWIAEYVDDQGAGFTDFDTHIGAYILWENLCRKHRTKVRNESIYPTWFVDDFLARGDTFLKGLASSLGRFTDCFRCQYCGEQYETTRGIINHIIEYVLPSPIAVDESDVLVDHVMEFARKTLKAKQVGKATNCWQAFEISGYNEQVWLPRNRMFKGQYVPNHMLEFLWQFAPAELHSLVEEEDVTEEHLGKNGRVHRVWEVLVKNTGIPLTTRQVATEIDESVNGTGGSLAYLVTQYPQWIERVKPGVYRCLANLPADAKLEIDVGLRDIGGDRTVIDVHGEEAEAPSGSLVDEVGTRVATAPRPVPGTDVETLLEVMFPGGVPDGASWSDMLFLNQWIETTKELLRRFS